MRKPTLFGKYLLLERVNVGGMAEVFIAKAFGVEGFERILAIKKILPTMAEDEEFITMFIDEARISVQLNHANIVHIHELGKHDDAYFIAMEYVAGRDLRTMLERYRRRKEMMPTAQAVYVASKICEGLDYAHRKKDARGQELHIIHRDVSPQNILCAYEGEVKIIDFGIAKAANRSQKTQAGILKGKFGYMSPEQVRGLPIDRRSDIFAVGVILYEMLTGEKLFVGESDFSTLEKVRNAEVPAPRQFNPNIPAGLEKVVLKALAREADERYQWCSELQEDLNRFLLAGDTLYSAKQLGLFMKEAFAEDLKREHDKMERFAGIERPEALATGAHAALEGARAKGALAKGPAGASHGRGVAAQGAPAPRIEGGHDPDDGVGTDRTQIVGGESGDASTAVSAATEAPLDRTAPAQALTAPPGEGEHRGGADGAGPAAVQGSSSLNLLDSAHDLRPLDKTGFRSAAELGLIAPDVTSNQRPPSSSEVAAAPGTNGEHKPRLIIGDAQGYVGETVIGPVPQPKITGESRNSAGPQPTKPARLSRDDVRLQAAHQEVAPVERRLPPVSDDSALQQASVAQRKVLVIGGVLTAVLVAVLVALVIIIGGSKPGWLVLGIDPAGAFTVTVTPRGDSYDGKNPIALEPGTYQVDLTPANKSYQREHFSVDIGSDKSVSRLVVLRPIVAPEREPQGPEATVTPPATVPTSYTGIIRSDEPDVSISIDGKPVGKTPEVSAAGLALGPHKVQASKPGFVTLNTDLLNPEVKEVVELKLLMTKEEPRGGLKKDPKARGPKTEPAPKPAVAETPRTQLTPEPARPTKAKRGQLACTTKPVGAEVWVDGKPTGRTTPIALSSPLELSVGKHRVTFKLNGRELTKDVTIGEREVAKLVGVPLE